MEVECILICLLGIWILSLVKCLFRNFAHFPPILNIGLFFSDRFMGVFNIFWIGVLAKYVY